MRLKGCRVKDGLNRGGGCRAVFMDEEAKSGDTKDSNGLVG